MPSLVCRSTNTCVDSSGTALSLDAYDGTYGVLQFPAQTFARGTMQFNVTAQKGVSGGVIPYHYRSATASIIVQVVDGLPPTLNPAFSSVTVNSAQPRQVSHVVESEAVFRRMKKEMRA